MATPGLSRKQFLLRATIVIGLLTWAYVASYARLYYRGTREIDCDNTNAFFFYVPLKDVTDERDTTVEHRIYYILYKPLNSLHRGFGGKTACRCVHFSYLN